jgi:hypothetical protein
LLVADEFSARLVVDHDPDEVLGVSTVEIVTWKRLAGRLNL